MNEALARRVLFLKDAYHVLRMIYIIQGHEKGKRVLFR